MIDRETKFAPQPTLCWLLFIFHETSRRLALGDCLPNQEKLSDLQRRGVVEMRAYLRPSPPPSPVPNSIAVYGYAMALIVLTVVVTAGAGRQQGVGRRDSELLIN